MQHNTLKRAAELLSSSEDVVVATIRSSDGSAPRHAGAQMVVTDEGLAAGTIGGGMLEHKALVAAESILKHRGSCSAWFQLTSDKAASLGMICGGTVIVDFRYLAADDPGSLSWVHEQMAAENQAIRVFVFGGGHVSQAVVPLLRTVGFAPVVLEDRPEFAHPDLFPAAAELKLIDMHAVSDSVTLTPEDYVLILTRGHEHDLAVQSQVMRLHPAYIGVIGSRTKTRALTDRLLAEGFSAEDFRNVFAPVGVPIGSETPEEIAVSIVAQLIVMRAQGLEAARRLS